MPNYRGRPVRNVGRRIVAAYVPAGWRAKFLAVVDNGACDKCWAQDVVGPAFWAPRKWRDGSRRNIRYTYVQAEDRRPDRLIEQASDRERAGELETDADVLERERDAAERIVGVPDVAAAQAEVLDRQKQRDEAVIQREVAAKAATVSAQIKAQRELETELARAAPSRLPRWAIPAGLGATVLVGGLLVVGNRRRRS